MQIRNSKLCEASKCRVYIAVKQPWCGSMLLQRRGLLWLVSTAHYCILYGQVFVLMCILTLQLLELELLQYVQRARIINH